MTPTILLIPAAIVAVTATVAYAWTRIESAAASRIRHRPPAPALARELPYWHLSDDGVLVHTDLSYSCFLAVSGVDTDCRSDAELQQITNSLHTLLSPLEPGVRLQWLYINDHDQRARLTGYQQSSLPTEPGSLITAEKVDAFKHTELRRGRVFLVGLIPGPSARGLRPAVDDDTHKERRTKILSLRSQLQSALSSAGLKSRLMLGEDVAPLLYETLNPARYLELAAPSPTIPTLFEKQTLREQLLFSGVTEGVRTLEVGECLLRVVSLKSLPNNTQAALVEHLTVGLPFPCRVSVAVELLDDRAKLERLKRRRDQAIALTRLRARPNQEAEAQARDLEDLIDEVLAGGNRLVHIALSVVFGVRADTPDAQGLLDQRTSAVLSAVAAADGAQGLVEEYGQLDAWLASLPAGCGRRSRWHSCTSENASHFFPAWESWPGHEKPALLFANGRRFLFGLNPFDPTLDNPNAFIAGTSGAGKSVMANYLLMHLLAQGARALIIDVGGSYRRLIELFGGDYVSLSTDADPALNLFQQPSDVITQDGGFDQLRMDFMLSVVSVLVAGRDRGPLTNEELAVLDKTIRGLYEGADETPILSDLFRALRERAFEDTEDTALARALSRRLRYWLEGPHARILNRQSNIRLTSDLAAFDLAGMPEEVRPAVLLIIAGIIWNLVRSQEAARKVVVFDEVWTLLSDPQSQKLLEMLYRTSRKHACSVLTISQSTADFTNSPIAPALVQNAATVYLLKHKHGEEDVAKVFHLNEREVTVFRDLKKNEAYSEMLVLSGRDHRAVVRVILTSLEYWIATTHPEDTRYLANVRAEHPDLSLLEHLRLCADAYPRGFVNA